MEASLKSWGGVVGDKVCKKVRTAESLNQVSTIAQDILSQQLFVLETLLFVGALAERMQYCGHWKTPLHRCFS
jgi:hypothetical protein